jgi:hypothetical protein
MFFIYFKGYINAWEVGNRTTRERREEEKFEKCFYRTKTFGPPSRSFSGS